MTDLFTSFNDTFMTFTEIMLKLLGQFIGNYGKTITL